MGLPVTATRSENADSSSTVSGGCARSTRRIRCFSGEAIESPPKWWTRKLPRTGQAATRAFFGGDRALCQCRGVERVVSIVGTDEVDLARNHISWVSPLGRALLKSAAGDSVLLQAPGGAEYLDVLDVCYERISVDPFREPPGSESSSKVSSR